MQFFFNGNNPAGFLEEFGKVVPVVFAPLVDHYGYTLYPDPSWNYEYRSEKLSLFVELDRTVFDVLFVPASVEPGQCKSMYLGALIHQQHPDFVSRRNRAPKPKELGSFIQMAFEEMIENVEPLVAGDMTLWPPPDRSSTEV